MTPFRKRKQTWAAGCLAFTALLACGPGAARLGPPQVAPPAEAPPRAEVLQPDPGPALVPEKLPRPSPAGEADREDLGIQLEPPSPDQLFRPESEAAFRGRLRQELERRGIPAPFPGEVGPAPPAPLQESRCFAPQAAMEVPGVVCYHPLYFEDPNAERYGWSLGLLQPAVSTGKFYFNTLMLPWHLAVMPCWTWECEGPGEPLPGDAVPYGIGFPLCRRTWVLKGPAGEADVTIGGCGVVP